MTIPWYSNCPHSESAWCLDCAADLGDEMVAYRRSLDVAIKALGECLADCGPDNSRNAYRLREALRKIGASGD